MTHPFSDTSFIVLFHWKSQAPYKNEKPIKGDQGFSTIPISIPFNFGI